MPKLTLDAKITIHFDYHKRVVDREYIEISHIKLPSDEDLEEWAWELKDEWKED